MEPIYGQTAIAVIGNFLFFMLIPLAVIAVLDQGIRKNYKRVEEARQQERMNG